jgi:hypothetical protein
MIRSDPYYATASEDPRWDPALYPSDVSNANASSTTMDFDTMYPNCFFYGSLDGFVQEWPFILGNGEIDPNVLDNHGINLDMPEEPSPNLQRIWYTNLENGIDDRIPSGYATPLPPHSQNDVDENYRRSLHRKLQIRPLDQNLPSSDYLNQCMKCYFIRFHPIFPVIHAPTFRPSKTNAVLLLSICSLGSLLTGHPAAYQRGVQLFERLHKAILNHWERFMKHGPEETLCMVQAALLGQTFGLLSGKAEHLALVDAFHGTVVSWARRTKLFDAHHQPLDLEAITGQQDLESRWNEWVRTEEKIRAASGLRIHDAEIACVLQHAAMLPRAAKSCPVAANDTLFFAANHTDWFTAYGDSHDPDPTPAFGTPSSERPATDDIFPDILQRRLSSYRGTRYFLTYAFLEDLSSAVMEARTNECLDNIYVQKTQQALMTVYRNYLAAPAPKHLRVLHSSVRILWHFIYIALYSDLDLLEKGIGRDGPTLSASDLAEIRAWAQSSKAKYSVAHAMLVKRSFEVFPLLSEPAIHVPRIVFACAICLICCSKYGDGTGGTGVEDVLLRTLNAPEFQLIDADMSSLLREANGYRPNSTSQEEMTGPVCDLCDLLHRIGHWEISRKFASILSILMQNGSNVRETEAPN